MLFENAAAETSLLLFTLLVPLGVTALALMACVRGFLPAAGAEGEPDRKANKMTTVPAVVMLLGLVCSFFHLGHPSSVFFMLSGIGSSPLSNEIVVAAVAIVVGAVYWALCLAKGLPASGHKAFGVVLALLALLCAVFTGVAYSIATIPTWDTPFNWLGQIGLSLLGGGALAAVTFALAGYAVERKAACALLACGALGCVLALITLIGQFGAVASVMSSTGLTLAAAMGDYAWVACVAALCMIASVVVWAIALFAPKADPKVLLIVAFVVALVGLVLMRVCFYGSYLSAGLAIL